MLTSSRVRMLFSHRRTLSQFRIEKAILRREGWDCLQTDLHDFDDPLSFAIDNQPNVTIRHGTEPCNRHLFVDVQSRRSTTVVHAKIPEIGLNT